MMRYYPFWAVPLAWILYEFGMYHYSFRDRLWYGTSWALSGFFSVTSLIWVVLEGYWRFGPFVKRFVESFQKPG